MKKTEEKKDSEENPKKLIEGTKVFWKFRELVLSFVVAVCFSKFCVVVH